MITAMSLSYPYNDKTFYECFLVALHDDYDNINVELPAMFF